MYELSEQQVVLLTKAANGAKVFAVLEPSEALDEPKRFEAIAKELAAVRELIGAGLLVDESAQFADKIQVCKISNKRGFQAFALTEFGLRCFHNCNDPECMIEKLSVC